MFLDACAAPGGKSFQLLSKKKNLTLNDKSNERIHYCNFEQSFSLLNKLTTETQKKIFIIGGNTIYNQYFGYCTKFHISLINDEHYGDTIFPYNIQYFQDNYTLVTKDVKNDFTYFMFEK